MKVVLIFSIISVFFFISCEGLLWNGQSQPGDQLTISIENPYYQSADGGSSRALALQGTYLYIELARIDDQAAYNSDGNLPLTGDGVWEEKSWGGHAILTFNLSNINAFIATFEGVPRGEDIKARVIQDIDITYVTGGLGSNDYGEVGPISLSYDFNAPDLFEPVGNTDVFDRMWIDVSSSDLNNNRVTIPIRVSDDYINSGIPLFNVLDAEFTEQYVDFSTLSFGNTEPNTDFPTEYVFPTKFSRINIDMSAPSDNIRDLGVFLLVDPTDNMIGNVVTILYESDGSPGDFGGNAQRYFYVAHPDLDGVYTDSDLFIGSTNISLIELSDANYSGGQYNVDYGILYDSASSFDTSLNYFRWYLPNNFLPGDLEFKLLFIEGQPLLANNEWETISQINALNPVTMLDWSSNPAPYTAYYDFDTTFWTNSSIANDHAVVLARVPGGSAFIFARAYYGGA